MINELINTVHSYISGYVETPFGLLCSALWDIFSQVNGNPELGNYGIRLLLMLFFVAFLIAVLQIRTRLNFDKKHMIAYVGTLFLVFRIITMMGFEWGWQIGIYDDWLLHLLSPPVEHFWNMLFFSCIAYYTLNVYDYYPGILKKIIYFIPVSIISFFVYSSITWKTFFLEHLPTISKYNQCVSDWQNHAIISIIALYVVIISVLKYKKYYMYLSSFWIITFLEHSIRTVAFYNGYEPSELATIFHAMATWALPLLILHFITAYIIRYEIPRERRRLIDRCDDCPKPTEDVKNG